MAAAVLMSKPMNVSTLGEIFVSARPLTMACSSTPQARPNAPVHVLLMGFTHGLHWFTLTGTLRADPLGLLCPHFFGFVDGGQLEYLKLALAVGRDDQGHVAHLLADEAAPDGRSGGNKALIYVGLFAGHEF